MTTTGDEDDPLDPFGEESPLIDPAELRDWVIDENEDVIVFNKPGWVVCHPSKNGPFSSLVGAAREVFGLDRVHLVSRLDRETSGLVILAKHRAMASLLQTALAKRAVVKRYRAILEGCLGERREVSRAMGPDPHSAVFVKQTTAIESGGQKAQTTFRPLSWKSGYTLVEVEPHTGRKHQIRVHARHLGHAVAGDKLYGPDESHYLEFVEKGWTATLAAALPLKRQALHAHRITFQTKLGDFAWEAAWPEDLDTFWSSLADVPEPVRPKPRAVRRRRPPATDA